MSHCKSLLVGLLLGVTAAGLAGASAYGQETAGATAAEVGPVVPGLVNLYRELHAQPELSYHEVKTAARMALELRAAGAEVTEQVGQLGVVGLLRNGEGPTVLLRADMDGLPVTEATDLPYASTVTTKDDAGDTVGVMHACGHDVHMTCLVGAAIWLNTHRDRWRGTVVLVAQPAEEKIGGAEKMLDDGLYTRFPRPVAALALHVTHDLETGKVAYTSGPALAGSTSVDIVVRGRGGHGAMPQNTVDPIVLASLLVLDLQTIVSREVSPLEPAVVTVGSIHGGSKHNIIPSEVHLQLTLRNYKPEVREQLIEGIRRRASALATAHRAPEPTVTIGETTPVTVNTPELVARVVPSLERALGPDNVSVVEPLMGAEDFGLFGRDGVPTFMFRLGTIAPERLARLRAESPALPSLHSPVYYPDADASIATGVRALTAAVCQLLPPQ
jgi:hippurate hydrolase